MFVSGMVHSRWFIGSYSYFQPQVSFLCVSIYAAGPHCGRCVAQALCLKEGTAVVTCRVKEVDSGQA